MGRIALPTWTVPFPGMLIGLLFGWYFGVINPIAEGIRYGGLFVILHSIMRLLLYRERHIPWDYADFLAYAAERIFLPKVGGYIFIHRMLMEHFAEMDEDRIEALAQGEYN